MNSQPSTEVVAATAPAASSKAKVKKIARVGGAAVFTFAMFGTLALPAYAFNDKEEPVAAVAESQTIKVTAGPALTKIDDIPLEVDTTVAEQEQREKLVAEAEKRAAELAANKDTKTTSGASATPAAAEVPAGSGASGLVAAALAQVGVSQDCTDLAQNALAAIGLTERRDQGGYDHGVSDFFRYGASVDYVHGTTALAPGDLLMWPGAPHVAVYIGGGQAVHGGWTGGTTVVAGLSTYAGLPTQVVRMS
ncbi:cell wall-associated NlpC family hydrolase [Leucobacter komagatae]|uniref:Cell wall-associated NlpC family hydrolase n=1 Tax=Leucobacter komagatae TaxID=55969 RepID=A0A542Y677_9MICO|nr:C40 family peptidase [Leucobacter komagatae]TQL43608.1 cell wall-associated NlpC family hydrolase [Leucobacter komagatae]